MASYPLHSYLCAQYYRKWSDIASQPPPFTLVELATPLVKFNSGSAPECVHQSRSCSIISIPSACMHMYMHVHKYSHIQLQCSRGSYVTVLNFIWLLIGDDHYHTPSSVAWILAESTRAKKCCITYHNPHSACVTVRGFYYSVDVMRMRVPHRK